ncbi:MAG: hypothetical protein N2449_07800 [Bacteroidales bacterium]|nr:hypothetical protein [Bacteroidales bacterium]
MKSLPSRHKKLKLPNKKSEFVLKWWHKLLFLSPIIIIALLFKVNDWYQSYMLHQYKDSTWATIIATSTSGIRDAFDTENVAYQYRVNDSTYTGYTSVPVNHRFAIGILGIPVLSNQRYKLYYAKNKPHIAKLDLSQPDSVTIQGFIEDASRNIHTIMKNIDINTSICVAYNIFKEFRYDGLAYVYFYDEYVIENFTHNSQTFHTFWNSDEVQGIIKNCTKQ